MRFMISGVKRLKSCKNKSVTRSINSSSLFQKLNGSFSGRRLSLNLQPKMKEINFLNLDLNWLKVGEFVLKFKACERRSLIWSLMKLLFNFLNRRACSSRIINSITLFIFPFSLFDSPICSSLSSACLSQKFNNYKILVTKV